MLLEIYFNTEQNFCNLLSLTVARNLFSFLILLPIPFLILLEYIHVDFFRFMANIWFIYIIFLAALHEGVFCVCYETQEIHIYGECDK